MKTAIKVFTIYLISILIFSLVFSYFHIIKPRSEIYVYESPFTPIMIVTIIGGFLSLRYTMSIIAFKLFAKIYVGLWLLSVFIHFLGNWIGEVYLFQRTFNFKLILSYHYENYTRLKTPMPFIVYWFINYIFSNKNVVDKKNK